MKIVAHELYKGIFPELPEDDVLFYSNTQMVENSAVMKEAEVIVCQPHLVQKDFLDICERVKWIQVPSAGFERSDIDEVRKRGIHFTNGTGNQSVSIAEDVMCKILFFSRRIREFEANKENKSWSHFGQDPWLSVISQDLYTKKMGIIGDGAIATEIAKRAKGFDMEVQTYGLYNKDGQYWDHFYNDQAGLDKLVATSDYIVVAVPLNEATHGMFNLEMFKKMKKEAIFVNIARGPIVVEDDLITALKNNEIQAAALDVFEVEPLPEKSQLWDLDNVFITSHKAGTGDSWIKRIKKLYEDNLELYRNGKPLINERSVGYKG